MLEASTLKFLKELSNNNNKPWFDEHRKKYEAAKKNFEDFVAELLIELSKIDGTLAHLAAKDCTFRINRDVRFSKDKSPYKNNMAMYASKGGKKAFDCGGYYLHVQPGQSFFAGGIWMPPAPILKAIRQEIDYNLASFKKIVTGKIFVSSFGGLNTDGDVLLSRPPKGYDDANPAIEFLKYKSFIASTPISDKELTEKNAVKVIAGYAKKLFPLITFLNHAVAEVKD